ncbi:MULTISPECIES: hypothetical protein [unclassified Actinotalea]|uniref:hypothetical protein n=1 Tax=unclassified Actinotalea TaxID=2638618 RepID=UPI0015F606B9|nr:MULTISPECIES: hypothetical protein [unclassified Actinotalea]
MPAHVVIGHAAAIVAPLAALLALVYALVPAARHRTRIALVVVAAVALALCAWAGDAGGDLLDRLTATAPQPLPAEVQEHAKGSDALTVSAFLMLTVAAWSVWRPLRPGRPGARSARVARVLLVLSAAAVLLTTVTVLVAAMAAVWATQPGWQ